MAGKQRANILASILSDPSYLRSVYETSSTQYNGSAQQELDKYLDSITAKLQQFTNEVHEFWTGLIDSDVVKFFVELGTQLLNVINNVGQLQSVIIALSSAAAVKRLGFFGTTFVDGNKKATIFKKTLGEISSIFKGFRNDGNNGLVSTIKTLGEINPFNGLIKNFNSGELEQLLSIRDKIDEFKKQNKDATFDTAWAAMGDSVQNVDERMKSLLTTQNGNLRTTDELKDAYKQASTVGGKFSSVVKSIGAGLFNAFATGAIMFGVQKLIEGIVYLATASQRAKEEAKKLINEYKTGQQTYEAHKKTVDEMVEEYSKLSQGVDRLGKNTTLTTEEYSKYQSYNKQIAEMFPTLIQGYNDTGDAIIYMSDATSTLNKQLEDEQYNLDNNLVAGIDKVLNAYKIDDDNIKAANILPEMIKAVTSNSSVEEINKALDTLVAQVRGNESLENLLMDTGLAHYEGLTGVVGSLGDRFFDENDVLLTPDKRKALLINIENEFTSISNEIKESTDNMSKTILAYFRKTLHDNTDGIYSELNNNNELKGLASVLLSNLTPDIISGFDDSIDVSLFVSDLLDKFQEAASDKKTVKKISDAYSILFANGLDTANLLPQDIMDKYSETISALISELDLDPEVYTPIFEKLIDFDQLVNERDEYKRVVGELSNFFKITNINMSDDFNRSLKKAGLLTSSSIIEFFNFISESYERGGISYVNAIELWKAEVADRLNPEEEKLSFSSLFSADSDAKDTISAFKTNIKQLGEAIANFQSLSPEEKTNIFETYAVGLEQMGFSGELTVDALQALANQQWQTVDALFDGVEGADEYRKALKALMDQAMNTGAGFKGSLKNIGVPTLNIPDESRMGTDQYVAAMDAYNRQVNQYEQGQKKLLSYTRFFTDAQKTAWVTAASGAKNADEAIQMWEQHLADVPLDNITDVLADEEFQSVKSAAEELREILKDGITFDERQTLLEKWGLTEDELNRGAALDLQNWLNSIVKLYAEKGKEAGLEWYRGWIASNKSQREQVVDNVSKLGDSFLDRSNIRSWASDLIDSDIEVLATLKFEPDKQYTVDQLKQMLRDAKDTLDLEGFMDLTFKFNGDETSFNDYVSKIQSQAQTITQVLEDVNRGDKTWTDILGDYDTLYSLESIIPGVSEEIKRASTDTDAAAKLSQHLIDVMAGLDDEYNNVVDGLLEVNNVTPATTYGLTNLGEVLSKLTKYTTDTKNGLKDMADNLDEIYFDGAYDSARSFGQAIEDIKGELDTLNTAYTQLIDGSLRENSVEFKNLVVDLTNQFPQLVGHTDSIHELAAAVAELMGTKSDSFIVMLDELRNREGIPDELRAKIDNLRESFQKLGSQPFSMDNAISVIKNARQELNQLADFMHEVNETGLHLDIDATDDVYNLYPELLKNAKIYRDGTIELNKDVYEAFINAKQAEVQGDIDARIKELQARNEVYRRMIELEQKKVQIANEAMKATSLIAMQGAMNEIAAIDEELKAEAEKNLDIAQMDADTTQQQIDNSDLKTKHDTENLQTQGDAFAEEATQESKVDEQNVQDQIDRDDDEKGNFITNMLDKVKAWFTGATEISDADADLNEQEQTNSAKTSETQQENDIAAGKTALGVMGEVSDADKETSETMAGNSEQLKTDITSDGDETGSAIVDGINQTDSTLAGAAYNAESNMAQSAEAIKGTINNLINLSHQFADAYAAAAQGKRAGNTTGVVGVLGGMLGGLKQGFNSIKKGLGGVFDSFMSPFKSTASSIGSWFSGSGSGSYGSVKKDLWTSMTDGIKKGVDNLTGAFTTASEKAAEVIEGIGDGAKTIVTKAQEFGIKLTTGIKDGDALKAVTTAIMKAGNWIAEHSGAGKLVSEEIANRYTELVANLKDIEKNSQDKIAAYADEIAKNEELINWLKANGGLDPQEIGGNKYGDDGNGGNDGGSSGRDSNPGSSGRDGDNGQEDKEEEQYSEMIDWIEVRIQRLERVINKLDKVAGNSFENFQTRNKAIGMEIEVVKEEFDDTAKAFQRYMAEADAVPLDEAYKQKIQRGLIDIETITDENLKKNIENYQMWYEKAIGMQDALYDLAQRSSELYKQTFENIRSQADAIVGVMEKSVQMINNAISRTQTQGYLVSENYYNALIENAERQLVEREGERRQLIAQFQKAVDDGAVEMYSEEWYSMKAGVDEVTLAIDELTNSIVEYNDQIRQIQWDNFDLMQSRISDMNSEAQFLIDLMSNEEMYNDEGYITNRGITTKGMHGLLYNTYMSQGDAYRNEMLRINEELANDPNNTKLYDRRQQLLELQQESIKAAESEKQALKSLVSDGIQKTLSALQKLITEYENAIQKQYDMYTFSQNVGDQTKNITNLQKQLASLSGDDSEENRKKLQELNNSLADAQQSLEQTLYERQIQDEREMLDDLYTKFDTVLNSRLDNLDVLLAENIAQINMSSGQIADTLNVVTGDVGYRIQSGIDKIFNQANDQLMPALATYTSEYMTTLSNEQALTNDAITGLKTGVIANITANAGTISGYINTMAAALGLDFDKANGLLGDSVYGIKPNKEAIDLAKDTLSGKITTSGGSIETAITTANSILNGSIGTINTNFETFQTDFSKSVTATNDKIGEVTTNVQNMIKDANQKADQIMWTIKNELSESEVHVTDGSKKAVGDGIYDRVAKVDEIARYTRAVAYNTMTQPAVPESNPDLSDLTGAAPDVKPPTNGNNGNNGNQQNQNQGSNDGKDGSLVGDGVPAIGDVVTYTGKFYWDSRGKDPAYDFDSGKVGGARIVDIAKDYPGWHPTHPYLIELTDPKHKGYGGFVELKQLSGYKSGTPSVDKDKFALMNEGGGMETVVRPDGTILTPLSKRTMVLNAESTSNMWRMLQDPEKFMGTVMKNADIEMTNNNGGSVENNIEVNIQVAHVDDFDDFMRQLQHSEKFEQLFSSMFDNRSKGTSKFNKFNVRI